MASTLRFLAGLVAGIFVGMTVAMMVTPAPTLEMRERLRAMARRSTESET
jgi:gas vesicle protein